MKRSKSAPTQECTLDDNGVRAIRIANWGDDDLVEYFLDAALLNALKTFESAGFVRRFSRSDQLTFYTHYDLLEADVNLRRDSWVDAWNEYATLPF